MFFGLDNFGDHISALRGVIKAFTGSLAYCSICSAHNKFADKIRIVWITEFVNVVQPFKVHHNFYWKRESKTEDKIYAHIYLFLDGSAYFRLVRDLSVQILIPPQIFWKHPFCDDVDWVLHQVLCHLFYLFFPFTVVSMIILFCKKGLIFQLCVRCWKFQINLTFALSRHLLTRFITVPANTARNLKLCKSG